MTGKIVQTLRILIIEELAIVREGLKRLFSGQPHIRLVGEQETVKAALELSSTTAADLIIVDSPALCSGAESLVKAFPNSKVVIFSNRGDSELLRTALGSGICGYILKTASTAELLRALAKVASGETYIDGLLAGTIISERSRSKGGEQPHGLLSDRERIVIQLVASGYTHKEIAAYLQISIKSVDTYRSRSMSKLGLNTRAELVHYAVSQGWLLTPALIGNLIG